MLICTAALLAGAVAHSATAPGLARFFGTKSRYPLDCAAQSAVAHGQLAAAAQAFLNEHCRPDSVYVVVRHAARWPTRKHMDKFSKLKLANWTSLLTNILDEGLLTPHGIEEARQLGAQMAASDLAPLFAQGYHPMRFQIKSSQITRALQTAHRFAAGVFGDNAAVAIASESLHLDSHLRFHEVCRKYQAHKASAVPVGTQARLDALVDEESKRLADRTGGIQSRKSLISLWNACKFEAVALHRHDHACLFFDEAAAEVLEYVEDVKDYWTKGYGHKLNFDITCDLMNDMVDFVQGQGGVTGRFMFGHAETILPLLARLGLFKDQHNDDGTLDLASRRWRTGILSPFAANIAVVPMTCDDGKRVVDLRHNQRSMDLTHLCGPSLDGLCLLDEFVNALRSDCNLDEICYGSNERDVP